VVHFNRFDARAAHVNRLAPRERARLPEASDEVAIAARDDGVRCARQLAERCEVAVIHVRVRDEYGIERG
jgi:hypothetical protein